MARTQAHAVLCIDVRLREATRCGRALANLARKPKRLSKMCRQGALQLVAWSPTRSAWRVPALPMHPTASELILVHRFGCKHVTAQEGCAETGTPEKEGHDLGCKRP